MAPVCPHQLCGWRSDFLKVHRPGCSGVINLYHFTSFKVWHTTTRKRKWKWWRLIYNDNWMPQAQGKPEETRKKMDLRVLSLLRAISVYTKIFYGLYKLVQRCTTLKSQKVTSVTSYVWILKSSSHRDHAMVSYAHYVLSAWSEVHLYTSRTWPETMSEHLFAVVVVIVINNDNDISVFMLCPAA